MGFTAWGTDWKRPVPSAHMYRGGVSCSTKTHLGCLGGFLKVPLRLPCPVGLGSSSQLPPLFGQCPLHQTVEGFGGADIFAPVLFQPHSWIHTHLGPQPSHPQKGELSPPGVGGGGTEGTVLCPIIPFPSSQHTPFPSYGESASNEKMGFPHLSASPLGLATLEVPSGIFGQASGGSRQGQVSVPQLSSPGTCLIPMVRG